MTKYVDVDFQHYLYDKGKYSFGPLLSPAFYGRQTMKFLFFAVGTYNAQMSEDLLEEQKPPQLYLDP